MGSHIKGQCCYSLLAACYQFVSACTAGPTAGGRDVQNGAQAPREHIALLDASNLLYRFHFGNSTRLKDKQQRDMTVIHHMLLYVLKAAMAEEVPVTRAVVVFDGPGEPSRRALFPAYKVWHTAQPYADVSWRCMSTSCFKVSSLVAQHFRAGGDTPCLPA